MKVEKIDAAEVLEKIITRRIDPLYVIAVLGLTGGSSVTCSAHGLIAVIPRDMPTRVDCPYCAVTRRAQTQRSCWR